MSDDPITRLRENVTELTATLVTALWLVLLFSPVGGNLWLIALVLGYVVVVPLVALLFGDESDREEWWEWSDETASSESADGGGNEDERNGVADERNGVADESNRDALETIRERYAAGELTDEQFEHKLERLLETETLEDVERWRRDARRERDRRDRDLEFET